MSPFRYYVYFEKAGVPQQIYARTIVEFMETLQRLIEQNNEMPEWICRVYK